MTVFIQPNYYGTGHTCSMCGQWHNASYTSTWFSYFTTPYVPKHRKPGPAN